MWVLLQNRSVSTCGVLCRGQGQNRGLSSSAITPFFNLSQSSFPTLVCFFVLIQHTHPPLCWRNISQPYFSHENIFSASCGFTPYFAPDHHFLYLSGLNFLWKSWLYLTRLPSLILACESGKWYCDFKMWCKFKKSSLKKFEVCSGWSPNLTGMLRFVSKLVSKIGEIIGDIGMCALMN